jgi:hypothetical protein
VEKVWFADKPGRERTMRRGHLDQQNLTFRPLIYRETEENCVPWGRNKTTVSLGQVHADKEEMKRTSARGANALTLERP